MSEPEAAGPRRVAAGFVLALAGALVVALAPLPAELDGQPRRVLGLCVVMATLWVLEALPLAVTAALPILALPVLGVATVAEAAKPYAHPLLFLMLGGFVIGRAMERVGLQERLLALLLRPAAARASPRRVLLAAMVAGALVSGLVNNTTAMVMGLPLVARLAERVGGDTRARSAYALGLAYAVSLGGVSTLVGTFPNAVFAKAAADLGHPVSFGGFSLVAVPFVLGAVPIAAFVVGRMLLPATSPPISAPPSAPWRPGERAVIGVIGATLLAWLTRKPVDLGFAVLPGWSDTVPFGAAVDDAWVALIAAGVLFLLRDGSGPLLTVRDLERSVPWSVVILLGGGFALADAIASSGLTAWFGGSAAALAGLPTVVSVLSICLAVTFITELTSNTATTQILLPPIAAGAVAAGVDPLPLMLACAFSASCAFMLPVGTPPNAIATQAGDVRTADMARAGLVLNVVVALWATIVCAYWVPWVSV